jgi:hypothetical protein
LIGLRNSASAAPYPQNHPRTKTNGKERIVRTAPAQLGFSWVAATRLEQRRTSLLKEIRARPGTPTSYRLGSRAMRPKRIIRNHFRSSLWQTGRPEVSSDSRKHARQERAFAYGPGATCPTARNLDMRVKRLIQTHFYSSLWHSADCPNASNWPLIQQRYPVALCGDGGHPTPSRWHDHLPPEQEPTARRFRPGQAMSALHPITQLRNAL